MKTKSNITKLFFFNTHLKHRILYLGTIIFFISCFVNTCSAQSDGTMLDMMSRMRGMNNFTYVNEAQYPITIDGVKDVAWLMDDVNTTELSFDRGYFDASFLYDDDYIYIFMDIDMPVVDNYERLTIYVNWTESNFTQYVNVDEDGNPVEPDFGDGEFDGERPNMGDFDGERPDMGDFDGELPEDFDPEEMGNMGGMIGGILTKDNIESQNNDKKEIEFFYTEDPDVYDVAINDSYNVFSDDDDTYEYTMDFEDGSDNDDTIVAMTVDDDFYSKTYEIAIPIESDYNKDPEFTVGKYYSITFMYNLSDTDGMLSQPINLHIGPAIIEYIYPEPPVNYYYILIIVVSVIFLGSGLYMFNAAKNTTTKRVISTIKESSSTINGQYVEMIELEERRQAKIERREDFKYQRWLRKQ